jgi:NTE family protein
VADVAQVRRAAESGVVVASAPLADGTTPHVTVASSLPGKADLVLEGGGVKGLGLVGATLALAEAGYEFQRIAGASAGAIVAALVASLQATGRPVSQLEDILSTIDYTRFAPRGLEHDVARDVRLLLHDGLYNGKYLVEWLGGQLRTLGVSSFSDLRIDDEKLPPERRYRLVVTVSDITRGKSARLPWDYPNYGLDPDSQLVVDAVRASMSIPFFFTPVHVEARPAVVDGQQLSAEKCTWVDGGMLDNFPVDVFDLPAGPGRWPTIGVKLSAQGPPASHRSDGTIAEALACLATVLDNADRFYVMPADAMRTIFVDHGDVKTTDFDITPDQQQMLLANGRAAAAKFLAERPEEASPA